MVTTVGNEDSLEELLSDLITLDYDAIEAYEAAIERLEDGEARQQLGSFVQDHVRHTENLAPHLRSLRSEVPAGSGGKSLLTEGKVVIAGLAGDQAILKAMASNEVDTVTAYGRAVEHPEVPSEVREKLRRNLRDEERHKAWIEQRARQL